MNKTILSGIQPTGNLHLGNYLGALQNWVNLQTEAQCYYCVVNYHAITVPQDPAELARTTREAVGWYLAAGVDPKQSVIFKQSDVAAHTELGWILTCQTPLGELERMTQFKEKSDKHKERSSAGLFMYPVLMAADILLYRATHVPVGEDQTQHVELTRTLARKWNKKYGEVFVVPQAVVSKEGARIMGLDDPLKKMSKSASSAYNYIALNDEPDLARKKIMKAVTDSGTDVRFGDDKPAMNNLLTIYQLLTKQDRAAVEKHVQGLTYAKFKTELGEVVVEFLSDLQKKYHAVVDDPSRIDAVLEDGANRARSVANETLGKVKEAMGVR